MENLNIFYFPRLVLNDIEEFQIKHKVSIKLLYWLVEKWNWESLDIDIGATFLSEIGPKSLPQSFQKLRRTAFILE